MIRTLGWIGLAASVSLGSLACVSDQPGENVGSVQEAHSKGHGDKSKVLICHIPPGNPANAHTIKVGVSAIPAHLKHGDVLGPCGGEVDDDDDDDDNSGCGDDDDDDKGGHGHHGGWGHHGHHGGWGHGHGHHGGHHKGPGGGHDDDDDDNHYGDDDDDDNCGGDGKDDEPNSTGAGGSGSGNGGAGGGGGDPGAGGAGGVGGDPVPECCEDQTACTQDSDCCSGLCGGSGICVQVCNMGLEPPPNFPPAPCNETVDCCSGVCVQGFCWTDAGTTCQLPGEPCDDVAGIVCCFNQVCGASGTCE